MTTHDEAPASDEPGGFIAPVPMEDDPTELFPGDTGTLDVDARKVLVQLLRRRFLRADRSPEQWRTLLAHQQVIESRLHDVFVRLVVDHDRGIAYKRQVRSGVTEVPVLLRDEAYTRVETVLLVHLRTIYQRERVAGESSARVDAEELTELVLSYLDPHETNRAAQQREVRGAVARLVKEGFIEEESEGRYVITPVVEVVLSVERLTELAAWLRDPGAAVEPGAAVPSDDDGGLDGPDDGGLDDGRPDTLDDGTDGLGARSDDSDDDEDDA